MRGKLTSWLLLGLACAAAGTLAAGWWANRELDRPLALPAEGLVLDVPAGASLRTVARDLAARNASEHVVLIGLYGRLTGAAARIKAGEYDIPAGTTIRSLLTQLEGGAVKLHAVTLVEGWRIDEAIAAIRAHPAIRTTAATASGSAVAAMLGLEGGSAEGWLFPDTYRFPRGTDDIVIVQAAHERMRSMLAEAWSARQEGLPIATPYEALTLASIVEKETRLPTERPLIAGVFVRRLRLGMRLQTDPTVIYGLGAGFDGNLRRTDLQRDTPYNTYTRGGLPPTPIALPGAGSLRAAVQPDDSGALFFVASGAGDGSHVFSTTLASHNRAVQRLVDRSRGASP